MEFIFNDGGRKNAGYRGQTGDCVTRAIVIITGKPYKEIYDTINQIIKKPKIKKAKNCFILTLPWEKKDNKYSARTGIPRKVYDKYLKSLGYEWISTMGIGTGCKVHLNPNELPKGRLIIRLSKHLTAVIDGVIYDTFDCSREENRCVYGYYVKNIDNSI